MSRIIGNVFIAGFNLFARFLGEKISVEMKKIIVDGLRLKFRILCKGAGLVSDHISCLRGFNSSSVLVQD